MSALSRRRFLSLTATGAIGSALVACGPSPVSGPTPPPARATIGADQTEWNRVLAAAKQEGTVIVAGPPGDSFREALTAFSKAYPEIRLDYTGFAGRDFAPRLIGEREAGQYLWDIHAAGPDTALLVLKPQGAYDPLGPALLLPEVTDDAKWLNGFTAGFLDNERQFVYAFAGYVVPVGSVNREFVPESELSSMEQLLDPRWRGKISWEDPRATGLGSADAGHLLMVLGEDFVSRLFQQNLVVVTDRRQQVEALVRGTYPIGGGIDPVVLLPYHEQGLAQRVGLLDRTSEAGTRLTVDSGSVMLINKAPHPNAARVYLNWLLSQDGQKAWVQATAANSRRLDVEGPSASAPDPQRKYRVINSEEYNGYITRAQALAQELLK